MERIRISVYFFLVLLFLFTGCNSDESKDSTSTSASTTEDSYEPDWENKNVGTGNKEVKDQLVKKYNSLLVFHADDTMQVNRTYTATLALARNAALGPLKMKVLEASDATDDNVIVDTSIQLGKKMKADLKDFGPRNEKSFFIERIGSEEQVLSNSKESFWQWNIEPLKEGHHKLKLVIQVILGDNDKVNLPTKEIPVTIFAQKISMGTRIGTFFSSYWQWIITGIFLPILIAWLTTRIKQANEAKKK